MPPRNFSARPAALWSTFASSVRARLFLLFIATSATSKPAPLPFLPMFLLKFPAITSSCPKSSPEDVARQSVMVNLDSFISNLSVFRQNTPSFWGKMNRTTAIASILFVGISLAPVGSHVAADEQPLFGYSAESSRTERQWEEKLRAIPSTDNLRTYMQKLSAHPHHVGSPADKDNAEWIAAKFKESGLDTHIEQFDVLYPTPKERVVELVEGGPKFVAKLQEPPLKQDPTSNQTSEQLPTYHVYSKDGDVTAPLVYVNYGVPED